MTLFRRIGRALDPWREVIEYVLNLWLVTYGIVMFSDATDWTRWFWALYVAVFIAAMARAIAREEIGKGRWR